MHLYFSFKDIIKTRGGKSIHSKPWGSIDFKVKLKPVSLQTATMVALLTKEKVIFPSLKRLLLQRPYWWEGRRKPDIILDSSQPTFRHLFLLFLSWWHSNLSVTILKIWSLWLLWISVPRVKHGTSPTSEKTQRTVYFVLFWDGQLETEGVIVGVKATSLFTGGYSWCNGILHAGKWGKRCKEEKVRKKKEWGDGGYAGRCQWTAWVILRMTCVFQTEQWHPNC